MNMPFKKIAIATAVGAALTASFGANAATMTAATATQVATNMYKATSQQVKNVGVISLTAGATDVFLGRSTGFNVVMTLTGAKFKTGAPALGASPTSGGVALAGPLYLGSALLALDPSFNTAGAATAFQYGTSSWSASIAGGGGAGATSVTYSVQPGTSSVGVKQGSMLNFDASAFVFDNVTALNTAGGKVSVTVTINDPVGGNQLGSTVTYDLITSVDGVTYTAPTGTTVSRIDVGTSAAHPSKTYFSSTGSITVLDASKFQAGSFTIAPTASAGCFGAASGLANCSGAGATLVGGFTFNTAADTLAVTITGTDLTPFRASSAAGAATAGYYIVTGGDACSGGTPVGFATAATTASSTTSMTATFAVDSSAGNTYKVCLGVGSSNTTSITAQALSLGVTYSVGAESSLVTSPSAYSGTLFPLQYNGSVKEVYFFNPASNTTQTSVLRVVNPSSIAGLVTIAGVRDDATTGTNNVTFNLPAGQAVQLTAAELEAGSAAGATLTGKLGAGAAGKKWHLTVTGEFANMAAQSVTRDAAGSLSNMSSVAP